MAKLLLFFAFALLAIACGSATSNNTASNRSNSSVAKTNLNAENLTPYSRSENAYTSAGNSSLGIFSKDVGKTASEIKLWENKEIDARLKKLMGVNYPKMKKSWNAETPIKKFGDFLMMTGCEQHNCGDNTYVIFMDKSEGNINVVHIKGGKAKVWKEHGEIDLPPPFAEELAAMTSNK